MKFFNFLKEIYQDIANPHDSIFEILIEKEFKSDLKFLKKIKEIKKIPSWLKTEEQDNLLGNYYNEINYLIKKYSNNCPSTLFPKVSKNLQIQYQIIHNRINYILEDLKNEYC